MIYHSINVYFVINELFFIHVLIVLKAVVKIGFSKIQIQF